MTEEENIRYECLKLALTWGDNEGALADAQKYADFVMNNDKKDQTTSVSDYTIVNPDDKVNAYFWLGGHPVGR